MPNKNGKPDECTVNDCLLAFNSFRSQILSKFAVVPVVECWNLSGQRFTGGSGLQFFIPFKGTNGENKRFRTKIYRMWFYGTPESILLAEDHEHFTVSHLCHNQDCGNPQHLVLEDLDTNKSRNCCRPAKCDHVPKCKFVGRRWSKNITYVEVDNESKKPLIKKIKRPE